MVFETHTSNKNAWDFKQRILEQQKKESEANKLAQRKREENELKLLKIQQDLDLASSKKQYYKELENQVVLKTLKDQNRHRLSQQELSLNK